MRLLVLFALLTFALACGPNPAAPVKVMAVISNSQGAYEPKQIELKTVTSITALQGTAAYLKGNASVLIDPQDPLLALNNGNPTDEQYVDILLKGKGQDVRANYIEKGGVLFPSDFHSWNMVATYFNFEVSQEYFKQLYTALPSSQKVTELGVANVLYFASYRDLSLANKDEQKDNAFYFSPIKSFAILPFEKLQKIPFGMNIGVIGHEYSHLVFTTRALGGALLAPQYGWPGAPFNLLKSIDEGFADFHGYGITCTQPQGPGCRPDFFKDSIDNAAEVAARDPSINSHCMTVGLRTAFNQDKDAWLRSGLQYQLGTLFATSLYQSSNSVGKVELMQKALLLSYNDNSSTEGFAQILTRNLNTPGSFTIDVAIDTIASHISDPDLKKRFCGDAINRLQSQCTVFPCTTLPNCPATTARGTACPELPPENP